MRGIVSCKAGVGTLERLEMVAEGGVLGVVGEVFDSHSECVVEVEVEGEGKEGL